MQPKKVSVMLMAAVVILLTGCLKEEKNLPLMIQKEIIKDWQFSKAGENEWLPATVPGTVHTDLMSNNIIEDPYYRLNERDVQWIDKLDWEYKTTFSVDKDLIGMDRIELDFKGLDTYAEVFVNNQPVLKADNMFRAWKVEVKKYVKEGDNELKIVFRSPVIEGLKKYDAQGYVLPVSENDQAEVGQVEGGKRVSIYTRKAGYHFGWDWGPRLVTSGVWRPIYLRGWNEARILDLQVVQHEVSDEHATFTAVFEIEAEEKNSVTLMIENDGMLLVSKQVNLQPGISHYEVEFEIENPELWWTNGLGDPHLYNISGIMNVGEQQVWKDVRIGIRTLELVREQNEDGTSFYFKLNGHPVFMKGANVIPSDMFLTRVTDAHYRSLIETAKNSNMNMLRIWGGGVYEDDLFYDLCDENGILVWQDFMFACAMFPGDSAFIENVRQEAVDNVKRLRNHPSIALWCGNNEILVAWHNWGWKRAEEVKSKENADRIWKAYEDVFHKTLPDVVEAYDPQRSYWASSPSSDEGIIPDLESGDEHYWGVWWGKEPFQNYATHLAPFMSEYGFQSFPELSTVRKYTNPEDLDIFSEVMKSHQRSSIGNETIQHYMLQEYKKPRDFESFLYVSHVLQAEGIRFALEGHRRAKPFTMGSLYWQLNDVWPGASWSSTDYYQNWKALQYYVKKGFEPLLISPYEDDVKLKIRIVNDRLEQVNGQLILKLMDFNGRVVWERASLVEIPGNSSYDYFDENKYEFLLGKDTRNLFMAAELIESGQVVSKNSFYFRPYKDLNIPEPVIDYTIENAEDGFFVKLTSDKLAKNVYLQIGDEQGFFSDNYFDMLPGSRIDIHLKTELSKSKLMEVFSVRSLYDAF